MRRGGMSQYWKAFRSLPFSKGRMCYVSACRGPNYGRGMNLSTSVNLAMQRAR